MKKNQAPPVKIPKILPHYIVVIAIFVIGLLIYHKAILQGVFLFDDNALIIDNPFIKNFSHIKDIFTTHLFKGSGIYSNFYRPMQSLSFVVDYHFWKLNPLGYHLVNVLIHIFNAIAVYFLIYIVYKKQYVAIVAGLLFCAHAVLSIVVDYVAARADPLSTSFFLSAMILYILYKEAEVSWHSIILYLSSIACFILGLLSKELALILPLVILLYLSCFSKKMAGPKKTKPNLIWGFFIIAIIYVLLRATVLNFTHGQLLETTTGKIPLYFRLLTTSKAFMIYLRLLLVPVGLHMEWNIEPARSLLQDEVFLSAAGLAAIGIFVYFLFRTSKPKFFAIGWFFITLLPYTNIFPLNYFMSESWLYIPSIGFFTLLAIYLYELKEKSKLWEVFVFFIVLLSILFYGTLTYKRADVWADPVKLYKEILKYSPSNTKARINLGVILAKRGLHEEAIKLNKEVSKLSPDDKSVHSNLATIYVEQKNYDSAQEQFEQAVKFDPNDYVALNNLGILYKQKGDIKKAMEYYTKALAINSNYPLTYNNIGNIYLESGQYDSAIRFYKSAIRIDPNKAAFYGNLGKAYKGKGMLNKARETFEQALKLDPNCKDAIDGLGALK